MSSFPVNSIGLPEYGLSENYYYPQIKTEFEANYTQTRKQFSRKRCKFELSWKLMTNSQYWSLQTFVYSNTGQMFDWQHPVTTSVHTCTFGSLLESTIVSPGFRSAKITLEEV